MGIRARIRKRFGERGANLVEFALLAPLLILLVLGIVEFGLKFSQYNEIRHAVREGARYAAVGNPDLLAGSPEGNVVKSVCDALNLPGATSVTVETTATGNTKGSTATITAIATVSSLTNAPLISSFVPSSLSNTATFRLERDVPWSAFGSTPCP